jgi:hypothetical protein
MFQNVINSYLNSCSSSRMGDYYRPFIIMNLQCNQKLPYTRCMLIIINLYNDSGIERVRYTDSDIMIICIYIYIYLV